MLVWDDPVTASPWGALGGCVSPVVVVGGGVVVVGGGVVVVGGGVVVVGGGVVVVGGGAVVVGGGVVVVGGGVVVVGGGVVVVRRRGRGRRRRGRGRRRRGRGRGRRIRRDRCRRRGVRHRRRRWGRGLPRRHQPGAPALEQVDEAHHRARSRRCSPDRQIERRITARIRGRRLPPARIRANQRWRHDREQLRVRGLHAAEVVDLPQVVDVVDDVVEGVQPGEPHGLARRLGDHRARAQRGRRARAGSGPQGAACGDHEHARVGRAIGESCELLRRQRGGVHHERLDSPAPEPLELRDLDGRHLARAHAERPELGLLGRCGLLGGGTGGDDEGCEQPGDTRDQEQAPSVTPARECGSPHCMAPVL